MYKYSIFLFLIFLSPTSYGAETIVLNSGEEITLTPTEETKVICEGTPQPLWPLRDGTYEATGDSDTNWCTQQIEYNNSPSSRNKTIKISYICNGRWTGSTTLNCRGNVCGSPERTLVRVKSSRTFLFFDYSEGNESLFVKVD